MLSVRSTYFAAMFSKSSNFKEEKESCVQFETKRVIMRIIIEYIYGGKIEVSTLTCAEVIELMKMLRFFCLFDGVEEVEDMFKKKLELRKYPLQEVFDVIDMVISLNMEKPKICIICFFAISLEAMNESHADSIRQLSYEIILDVLKYIDSVEKRISPRLLSCNMQLRKLEFVSNWIQSKGNNTSEEMKNKFQSYFKLENFTVNQLVGAVRDTNIFHLEDILEAVQRIVILNVIF